MVSYFIKYYIKVKVKRTLVETLRLCTGHTTHRGSRGIALLFFDHGIRRGWGVSITPRPLFTPGRDPVPTVKEAGWAPGPVWTGVENLAPTWIRSLYHPARSIAIPATLPSPQNIPWLCLYILDFIIKTKVKIPIKLSAHWGHSQCRCMVIKKLLSMWVTIEWYVFLYHSGRIFRCLQSCETWL